MRLAALLAILLGVFLAACSGSNEGTAQESSSVIGDVDPNLPLTDQVARLPGVFVNDRGELRIRGSTQPPLVVIDGMQAMTADLRSINPADVDQIEVLKGAEASMYGVRGGSGVIVITTRTGGS